MPRFAVRCAYAGKDAGARMRTCVEKSSSFVHDVEVCRSRTSVVHPNESTVPNVSRFGLELHPAKTWVLLVGHFAREDREELKQTPTNDNAMNRAKCGANGRGEACRNRVRVRCREWFLP